VKKLDARPDRIVWIDPARTQHLGYRHPRRFAGFPAHKDSIALRYARRAPASSCASAEFVESPRLTAFEKTYGFQLKAEQCDLSGGKHGGDLARRGEGNFRRKCGEGLTARRELAAARPEALVR